jgi:hypothetical protein
MGWHLMRHRLGLMGPISQTLQTMILITTKPRMHRLPRHPELGGNLTHPTTISNHRKHGLITLFHNTYLSHHGESVKDQAT